MKHPGKKIVCMFLMGSMALLFAGGSCASGATTGGSLVEGGVFAYIDPGTGSMMLQILIGSLIGIVVAVKMFWGNIKGFLSRRFAKSRKKENDKD